MKRGNLKLSANIELLPNKIRVAGNDVTIMKVIDISLDFPTKKKIRMGNITVKIDPENLEENLRLTLKQKISYPYIMSKKNEIITDAKYEKFYDSNILAGPTKDRRVKVTV
jgi:hypothetical protein